MKINHIILIALIGMLGNIISTPTAVALPPFSGVIEYYHSAESGYTTIGAYGTNGGGGSRLCFCQPTQNICQTVLL
ncbi:MAG: hypothetical protein WCE94_04035 [Candidatus Methanoperedens sp.]